MAASRKSTPRRARSSSVTSNASVISTRSGAGAGNSAAEEATGTPKKEKKAPATPRRSSKSSKESSNAEPSTPASAAGSKSNSASKPASATKKTPTAAAKAPASASKAPASASKSRKAALTPTQKQAVANRPALPKQRNTLLPEEQAPVKLQIIRREGADIIIGRVKLPTSAKPFHGFLLRRFDTNALAASAMFRLAFPKASEEAEEAEMVYLEKRYETDVANGGTEKVYKKGRGRASKKTIEAAQAAGEEIPFEEMLPKGSTGVRLQGTWVPCADALELAKEYGLDRFAKPLIEAKGEQDAEGAAVLTPSKSDHVSIASVGHRPILAPEDSPSKARLTKKLKDGSTLVLGSEDESEMGGARFIDSAERDRQIAEQQKLARDIQEARDLQASRKAGSPQSSRKRRAVHQSPGAHNNALSDEEDYEHSNTVVRSIRRTTRAARRRPVATTAGALGAAGAVGAGALAWLSGGNLDVATQLVQQGIHNLGQWFFF